MTLHLQPEQAELQKAAIEFARAALGSDMIAPRSRRRMFDRDGWQKCAEFGVLGMPIPQEYGGLGLGSSELLAVMEGLGLRHARPGAAVLAQRAPLDQLDPDPALRHRRAAPALSAAACATAR